MAIEAAGKFLVGVTASADLSAKQFRFVKVSGDFTATVCAAATDIPCGVLQDKPTSGTAAAIMVDGISKVVAGGTIAAGALVGTDANGAAVALVAGTDTTKYPVAQALQAAVSGDIFSVELNCAVPHRAA